MPPSPQPPVPPVPSVPSAAAAGPGAPLSSPSSPSPRIGQALATARALGVERLDAQLLLAMHLQRPRAWLLAHDDDPLAADVAARFHDDLARRAAGEPLAYLVGRREFFGLDLAVTRDVLVPRPDTEVLVDWALDVLKGPLHAVACPQVADLGTGSGAVALALKHHHPRAEVVATDFSAAALQVAAGNATRLGIDARFVHGDWWGALGSARFHLAVSNPPYIADDDVHLATLTHEPTMALTPGGDGLDAIRRLIDGAAPHLQPGGWLLLEHGHEQAAAVRRLLHDGGFVGVDSRRDLAGHERCSGGSLPG